MEPIILIILAAIVGLFIIISLVSVLFNKQDFDESRVILPK
jgi:hypothetical protein